MQSASVLDDMTTGRSPSDGSIEQSSVHISQLNDRIEAGKLLASRLSAYRDQPDCVVIGLARGGVPVAYEIASALHLPLDICIVRKLGYPLQPELAVGAIGPGDLVVWNNELVRELHISPRELQSVIAKERDEILRREKVYRQGRTSIQLAGKTVILVDDGVATGASLLVAIQALRRQQIQRLTLAVGVAPRETLERLKSKADEVVCLFTPEPFVAISLWYREFPQVTDAEVQRLLSPKQGGTTDDSPA
jgi:putative phosphoribosyl transferase